MYIYDKRKDAFVLKCNLQNILGGSIGCTVKLKDVKTGNTLNGKDTEKLMAALLKMRQEDPTWVVEQSKELRQVIVHGQGEFHLRTLKWRLEMYF